MFLNALLSHRFFGIWCLVLAFALLRGRATDGGEVAKVPEHPSCGGPEKGQRFESQPNAPESRDAAPVPAAEGTGRNPGGGPFDPTGAGLLPSWAAFALTAAATWAWVGVLARGLPPWRVTMAWGTDGLVLFDSRAPLWAALGIWGLVRRQGPALAELAPYMLVAAWIADPGAFTLPWLIGGFQTFSAGEGLPNLAVVVLPILAWAHGGGPVDELPGARSLPDTGLAGLLIASCFWGLLPALVILVWADCPRWMGCGSTSAAETMRGYGSPLGHSAGPSSCTCSGGTDPSYPARPDGKAPACLPPSGLRRAGAQALFVAALLEWLETSTIAVGGPAGGLVVAALFALGRILPIGGKMVF